MQITTTTTTGALEKSRLVIFASFVYSQCVCDSMRTINAGLNMETSSVGDAPRTKAAAAALLKCVVNHRKKF